MFRTPKLYSHIAVCLFVVYASGLFAQIQPTATAPAKFQANCNEPPLIFCPADFQACIGASTLPSNTGYAITEPGNILCDQPLLNYSDDTISTGPCADAFTIERTWTATDPYKPQLTTSCVQMITIGDTTAPVFINCPKDTTIAPNIGCMASYTWIPPFVTDDCGQLNLEVTHINGDKFPKGETVVTYKAIDACGNASTCSFVVRVKGECCDLPPIIICPQDFTGCPGDSVHPKRIGKARAMPGRAHCAQPEITWKDDTTFTGNCIGGMIIERTWVARDPHDKTLKATCIQTITLKDETAPFIFACPPDVTVDSDEKCMAIVDWVEPTILDNCDTVIVTQSHVPGDTFPVGGTIVTYTATDLCGNTANCTFEVTVNQKCCVDNPLISCPSDYYGCPGADTDPRFTGTAIAAPGGPNCKQPSVRFEETIVSEGPCPGEKVIKRLWIAQDSVNPDLRSTCIQFLYLRDTLAPTFTFCPADTVVKPNSNCDAVVQWNLPQVDDNCGIASLVSNFEPGDTFPIGNTTVTYIAMDSCGNSDTCNFIITVLDECCNQPPIITCPLDYVGCLKSSTDTSLTGIPQVDKFHPSCGPVLLSYTDDTVSTGPCPNQYLIERTWEAKDSLFPQLVAYCTQVISLEDNEDPFFWECPNDTLVDINTGCQAVVHWIPPVAMDSCGLVSVTSTHQPGDTFDVGITTVIYTAVDACGNDSTCTFTITVIGTCCDQPPLITCPADFRGCVGIKITPDVTGEATAVPGKPTCEEPIITFIDDTLATGTCGRLAMRRVWTATDPNDTSLTASCIQQIFLNDADAPNIIDCPTDMTVKPNDSCEAVVKWIPPTTYDTCSMVTLTSTHEPGDTFPVGSTTVTYTATDACGNISTCSFEVTVTDDCCTKPPVLMCPMDHHGCPGSSIDPSITGQAMAMPGSRFCAQPILTYRDFTIGQGPCAGQLRINRIWVATDPDDPMLQTTCLQILILQDTIDPVIENCPADTTLSPNFDCQAIVFWDVPNITDNCDSLTIVASHQPGDTFDIGVTIVTYVATDGCDNSTVCSFAVEVLDDCCNKPPIISCPPNFSGCPGIAVAPAVAGQPMVEKGHPSCDLPILSFEDDTTFSDPCGELLMVRTWTATDPNNVDLKASCVQTITLLDTVAPIVGECPTDSTLSPNLDCQAIVFWEVPTATDNCDSIVVNASHEPGDTFDIGTSVVVYSFSDRCGNISTCSFTITVLDDCCNKPPVITCPSDFTGCPGMAIDPSATGQPTVEKGHPSCDLPVLSFEDDTISLGPCVGALEVSRLWTALDPNTGLADSCIQNILLQDIEAPVLIDCPVDTTIDANGECAVVVSWTPPLASDNCSLVQVSASHQPGDTFEIGITTVTYTATDDCGNVSTCAFDINVDGQGFELICPSDTLINNPTLPNGEYVYWQKPEVQLCGGAKCVDTIPGFIYMGELNGHRYFCSLYSSTWEDAKATCEQLGGTLAVINSQEENDYVASKLMGMDAFIGLSDRQTEGSFEWVDGSPLNYTNWAPGQPDNLNGLQDYVEMAPDGLWSDEYGYVKNEFVCEISCYELEQLTGPENGGFFPCGTTTVTYAAEDANGNTDTCSFDVTVDCSGFTGYCPVVGLNSSENWIQSVGINGKLFVTGDDSGYGDHTGECLEMVSPSSQDICLELGYTGAPRNVFWKVWIDYNKDLDFNDPGEEAYKGYGKSFFCGTLNFPADLNVRTTMRVAISYGQWPKPCGIVPSGEYEDYCVLLEDGTISLEKEETGATDADQNFVLPIERKVMLFPNPVHDRLNVGYSGEQPVRYEVYDILGQRVDADKWSQERDEMSLDIRTWTPGQYIMKLIYEDGKEKVKNFVIAE